MTRSRDELSEDPPILECRDLGRCKRNRAEWLIQHVSLRVRAGDRIGLSGPSGSGKTILLRALALLDLPDAGEVLLRGQVPRDADIPSFRKQIMYVHQRPYLAEGTVEANLMAPFQLASHRSTKFDRDWAIGALHRLGKPPNFLTRTIGNLSGGELQIVAIMRAIQSAPSILLLDEPTASADAATAQAIEQLVLDWQRRGVSRALVWVSHQADQTDRIASRRLFIHDGQVQMDCAAG